jgi:hypothetical protein
MEDAAPDPVKKRDRRRKKNKEKIVRGLVR